MPTIRVNLTGIESPSDLPIPEGVYPVVVKGMEIKQGPAGPYINWMLDISEGEFVDRRVWYITSMSDKPFPRKKLREAFAAFGVAVPEMGTSGVMEFDTDEFLYVEAMAKLIQEEYNNEMRNRVDQLFPAEARVG